MDYPVIDPVKTGKNIRKMIQDNGMTMVNAAGKLGLADKSTLYKWIRGDALPGIDNMLALSILLDVSINDILVTKNGSVVQMESMTVPKTADFGSYPNGPVTAPWCNGNTPGSDPGIAGFRKD